MALPLIAFYESDDSAPASIIEFTAVGGVVTAGQQRNAWNDKGGAALSDDATEVKFSVMSRDAGSGDFRWDHPASRDRWAEIRVNGPTLITPWTPVGRNRWLEAIALASDSKHNVEMRLNVPPTAGTVHVECLLVASCLRSDIPVDMGHDLSGQRGVLTGTGDPFFSAIVQGYLITPQGSPDDTIDISTGVHQHKGAPYTTPGDTITLNDEDGSAATLGADEEYLVTYSVGDSGLTETKGDKGASPIDFENAPAVPDGEILVGHVRRHFDGTIGASDIDQVDRGMGFFGYEATGLNVTVFGGRAFADDRIIARTRQETFALTPSSDNYLILHPDASLTVQTTAVLPDTRCLIFWKWTTDGSGITAFQDLRPLVGPRVYQVRMVRSGTLAGSQFGYGVYACPWPGTIRPIAGVCASVQNNGATSGSTDFDIRKQEIGGAKTTIFTSAPTPDLRPTIEHDSTHPVTFAAIPEDYRVGPGALFEFEILAVPGTASEDAEVVVLVEMAQR